MRPESCSIAAGPGCAGARPPLRRGGRAVGQGDARHAEDRRDAIARPLRCRMALEIHQDAPRELLDRGGPGVRERALDVAPEVAQEERAVAALEADLVVMDDERGPQAHHQPISAASARACASSSGVLTFMNATSGARWRATAAASISSTRTSGKNPTILSWPARSRASIGPRHALAQDACPGTHCPS